MNKDSIGSSGGFDKDIGSSAACGNPPRNVQTGKESGACGFYRCTICGVQEKIEREVQCWTCGRGEMVWVSQSEAETRNGRVARRWDELSREGKHGHYETLFRVVREECERQPHVETRIAHLADRVARQAEANARREASSEALYEIEDELRALANGRTAPLTTEARYSGDGGNKDSGSYGERAAVVSATCQDGNGSADDIRAQGWAVAVHNDYRLNGEPHTFWLLTKAGRAVKGEGKTDADALNQIRAAILSSEARRTESAALPYEQKQSDKARIERLIEQLTKKRIQISDYIAGIDPTTGDSRAHALTIAEGRLLQIDMDIEAARALTRGKP